MKKKKNSPVDKLIFTAMIISSCLYVMQFYQIVDIPLWAVLLPLSIVSVLFVSVMVYAAVVAILFSTRRKHERKT